MSHAARDLDMPDLRPPEAWKRRAVLKVLAGAGAGSAVFVRALSALAQEAGEVTGEMISRAEWIAGLELTEQERELMRGGLSEALADFEALRKVPLDNSVPPALVFDPFVRAGEKETRAEPRHGAGRSRVRPRRRGEAAVARPAAEGDLAFLSVGELGALLRARRVSSEELTRLYLERLERYDPVLECVITPTPELALEQARRADREIAAGQYRGPLHGVPWGAKDLIAVPGYPTTWGAAPYREQVRSERATVAERLERAGAVLVAKLSVGALAWGDVWFGGTTKNPWKPDQGSSGSSAGPGAATAAGLVGFSLGTETWGSIVSPSTRCGVTGLRPTFGRVSRYGVMALSWSMDKVGPMCRSVDDCAIVFDAIRGSDGKDPAASDGPFRWPAERAAGSLRIGFVPAHFEDPAEPDVSGAEPQKAAEQREEWKRTVEWRGFDRRSLDVLRKLGFTLVPIELPADPPVSPLSLILTAEASTAFDELTRSGRDDLLVRQVENAWPNVFRQGQFIPAVEYVRANRIRTLLMGKLERSLAGVDAFVAPTFEGDHLLLTNLTGHPSVVVPNGYRSGDGTPTSITFSGRLWGEDVLLSVARAYQQATDYHLRRPPGFD